METDFRERLRREDVAGEWRLIEGDLPETLIKAMTMPVFLSH